MKQLYLSYIRIGAVIFVILSHAFAPYEAWNWISNDLNSFFSITNKIIGPFVSMMPLLTFVSGYLFYTIRFKYISFKYLLKKKFERLIVPMIFFGIIYYLLFEKTNSFGVASINTILSGYSILWYCNMLFLCFIVAYPITKYIKNTYLQFMILFVSFGLIYINVPFVLGLNYLTKLFFYFYFGFVFSELVSKYRTFNLNTIILILGSLFAVAYALYEYNSISELNNRLIKVLSGNMLRISFILFIILLLRSFESQLKYSRFLQFLDVNSFGCYVFHYPIIYFLYKTQFIDLNFLKNYWFFPITVFMIATIVAYLVTYFFRKSKIGLYMLG
jgi:fucose 4-O-acetylase-like acetyltransferase